MVLACDQIVARKLSATDATHSSLVISVRRLRPAKLARLFPGRLGLLGVFAKPIRNRKIRFTTGLLASPEADQPIATEGRFVKIPQESVVKEVAMTSHIRALFVGLAAGLAVLGSGFPSAQASSATPTSSGVAQQFKSGADRVGEGATQIGEGIKNGAIMTWEAIKAGASAAAAKLNSNENNSQKRSGRAGEKP